MRVDAREVEMDVAERIAAALDDRHASRAAERVHDVLGGQTVADPLTRAGTPLVADLKHGAIDATRLAERRGGTRSYLLRGFEQALLAPALTHLIVRAQQPAGIIPAVLVAPSAVAQG